MSADRCLSSILGRRLRRVPAGGARMAAMVTLVVGCTPEPGACPDSADRLDASVLGVEGAAVGHECDALCPGGVPLGSVEGTVGVWCGLETCDPSLSPAGRLLCGFSDDLEAWRVEKCPGCVLTPYGGLPGDPYPETCAFPYDYLVVQCDLTK